MDVTTHRLSTILPLLLTALLLLTACQPDTLKLDIYTTDVALAEQGEIIQVPMQVSFELLGEDREGLLDSIVTVVKKYLPEKTQFNMAKSMMGRVLVIDSSIPMGNAAALEAYLTGNVNLAYLNVDNGQISLQTTQYLNSLSSELQNINMMISIDPAAASTVFNVISDSRTPITVQATAVFVSKSPRLHFEQTLNRRESVEIEFSGKEGSVYSELQPVINL